MPADLRVRIISREVKMPPYIAEGLWSNAPDTHVPPLYLTLL